MANTYSQETKAAVMAALLTGQSIRYVAKEFGIPVGTIKAWKSYRANGHNVALVTTEKKQAIGDLILIYLNELFTTLHVQMKVFADETWLKQQSAGEAAILHGVIADKGIRLLEALADRGENDNPIIYESDRVDSI
jgi:hypothetical protein